MGSYYLRGRIQEKSLKKSKWYTKPILDHKLEGLGKYWQSINICHSEFFEWNSRRNKNHLKIRRKKKYQTRKFCKKKIWRRMERKRRRKKKKKYKKN